MEGLLQLFFAKRICDYIINGIEKVEVNIYDVQDSDLREKLTQVPSVS